MIEAKSAELPAKYQPDFMERLDGRTTLGRSVKNAKASIVADLGGEESLSYLQLSLVDRTVFREAVIQNLELDYADAYTRGDAEGMKRAGDLLTRLDAATNSFLGLVGKLGLKRQPKTAAVWDAIHAGRIAANGAHATPAPQDNPTHAEPVETRQEANTGQQPVSAVAMADVCAGNGEGAAS